jgi:chaperone modulatory protein CbpM
MSARYSEAETIAAIATLTRPRLMSFLQAEVVVPVQTDHGPMFRQIDIVRLELLCDLSDQFDLQEDALGVVMSLIDQLHGVRAELQAVMQAVQNEPKDVRERVAAAVLRSRATG